MAHVLSDETQRQRQPYGVFRVCKQKKKKKQDEDEKYSCLLCSALSRNQPSFTAPLSVSCWCGILCLRGQFVHFSLHNPQWKLRNLHNQMLVSWAALGVGLKKKSRSAVKLSALAVWRRRRRIRRKQHVNSTIRAGCCWLWRAECEGTAAAETWWFVWRPTDVKGKSNKLLITRPLCSASAFICFRMHALSGQTRGQLSLRWWLDTIKIQSLSFR